MDVLVHDSCGHDTLGWSVCGWLTNIIPRLHSDVLRRQRCLSAVV